MLLVCSLFDVPVGVCAYVLRDRHRSFVSFCEQDLDPHVRVGTTAKRLLVGASIIKKLLVLAAVAFAQVAGSHYHSFWVGDGRLCQR